MPTITPTQTIDSATRAYAHLRIWKWTVILAADVYTPIELPEFPDRSVQMSGTWGIGSITLEGSIDGTTYFTLTDPQGNDIIKTADALEAISENVRYIRPNPSINCTNVTVYIMSKG